jgi:tetratricopeptide (TPR) repeat protein
MMLRGRIFRSTTTIKRRVLPTSIRLYSSSTAFPSSITASNTSVHHHHHHERDSSKAFLANHCSDLFFITQSNPLNESIHEFYHQYLNACIRLKQDDYTKRDDWIADYNYVSRSSLVQFIRSIRDAGINVESNKILLKKVLDGADIVLQRFQSYTNDAIFVQFCRIMLNVLFNEQERHIATSCEQLEKSILYQTNYGEKQSPGTYDLFQKICDILILKDRVTQMLHVHTTINAEADLLLLLDEINQYIEKHPLLEDYYLMRVRINIEIHKYDQVIKDCTYIIGNKQFQTVNQFLYTLHRALAYKGLYSQTQSGSDLKQAITDINRCLKSKTAPVLFLHSASLHFVSKDFVTAMKLVREAVTHIRETDFDLRIVDHIFSNALFQYLPKLLSNNQVQIIHLLVDAVRAGQSVHGQKRYTEALRISRKSYHYLIYYFRGVHYVQRSKYLTAMKDFTRSITKNENFVVAYCDLAMCHHKRALDSKIVSERTALMEKARIFYEQSLIMSKRENAITNGFDEVNVIIRLSSIEYYQGKYHQSENRLLQLLQKLPNDSIWRENVIDGLRMNRERINQLEQA